jgi:hypothetical protein
MNKKVVRANPSRGRANRKPNNDNTAKRIFLKPSFDSKNELPDRFRFFPIKKLATITAAKIISRIEKNNGKNPAPGALRDPKG